MWVRGEYLLPLPKFLPLFPPSTLGMIQAKVIPSPVLTANLSFLVYEVPHWKRKPLLSTTIEF